MLSRMVPMLWVVCLGVIVLFGFFAALGLFSPAEVIWLSAGIAVLAVLFTIHAIRVRRQLGKHGNREMFRTLNTLRERRGF